MSSIMRYYRMRYYRIILFFEPGAKGYLDFGGIYAIR